MKKDMKSRAYNRRLLPPFVNGLIRVIVIIYTIPFVTINLKAEGESADLNGFYSFEKASRILGDLKNDKSDSVENEKKAIHLLQVSSARGCIRASLLLGTFYLSGTHVPANAMKGIDFLQYAAGGNAINESESKASTLAKHNLGVAYVNGIGELPPNKSEGIHWLEKAAALGFSESIQILDEVRKTVAMRGENISELSAAEQYSHALTLLKRATSFRDGVYWLQVSAESDYAPAFMKLAELEYSSVNQFTEQGKIYLLLAYLLEEPTAIEVLDK
jgi:TPR repeat protein